MHKLHCGALEAKMKPAASEDPPLDADHVYLLMTDKYRISRNIRAQWYLQTLNMCIQTEAKTTFEDFHNEIDIISIYSTNLGDVAQAEFKSRNFMITPNSQFKFFSRKYSFVYILDLSTSVSNVDIQHSSVLTDELFPALSKCLQNLIQPFIVPGSCFLFNPEIYISILVYSPFYSSDINNVIVHGYKLSLENIDKLLGIIKESVYEFIDALWRNIRIEGRRLDGAIHRQNHRSNLVLADQSLVNMIRFGLLTLNLLPENSHEGIVIVTDGSFSFPDSNTLESALGQLRLSMISCSFIQIGSPAHPDAAFGHVPYNDFMKFLSTATFGAYLSISPDYVCDFEANEFNVFHKAFLVWSFHYNCSSFFKELRRSDYQNSIWSIDNPYFYSTHDDFSTLFDKKDQHMIRKRQHEATINASLAQILTYRLREGFTIKRVNFKPNNIEMLLVLPWRHNVNIEYNVFASNLPDCVDEDEPREITYEIMVEGSYSFLHDVTCSSKKPFKSIYRGTTIKQFWSTLKSFADSDRLGIYFHHFAKNELFRSMPESVKKGVPLFYLPPNANRPEVQFANDAHSKFSHYWKPICLLDVNMCQRSSLHTFQVNLLLRHDTPLPEFLYQPNTSGRYDNIQCNQAMSVLNVMLKEWSSFVLLENHSYIKLIGNETFSATCSFYLVRVVSQPPCIVLHLAFIGGTSSCLRNQIISELTQKLKQCKLPQRNLSSSLVQNSSITIPKEESTTPVSEETESSQLVEIKIEPQKEDVKVRVVEDVANISASANTSEKRARNLSGNISCFILLERPIERMLVRYERIPKDLFTCYKYEEDMKSTSNNSKVSSLFMFQTLTRYLCHKRFIWSTHNSPHTQRLSISSVSKILSVLTMKRIQEGFHLAYNDGGIVNLVMELKMRDQMGIEFPCLVQYIIFPSNVFVRSKDSISVDNDYDEESSTDNGEHLVVTECWVEPQNGHVASVDDDDGASHFLQGRDFDQISVSFFRSDLEVISSLLTYEHLLSFTNYDPECPMCPNELYQPIASLTHHRKYDPDICGFMVAPELHRFNHTRYTFNLLNLLLRSQQALIKFSMLCQTFEPSVDTVFDQLSHMNDCTNMILYSEFLVKLLHMHDKELEFSHADSISFIEMSNQRLAQSGNDRGELFTNFHLLIADPTIQFKCYCKQISANCLVVTILPFSYKVVRKLSFIAEATKRNEKLITELHDQYGSLVVPIFIFKLTFSNLSNILLNTFEGDDLVENENWNLYFDYSLTCNKFFDIDQSNTKPYESTPRPDEVALEDFCKSVEILYWNSFTDAVYKSLQYGFKVDDRDVTLVLEKISLKSFHFMDITEFLIYTCKHLKPLVNVYFERFPDNCINDLIHYILDSGYQDPERPFELLKLKDIFNKSNCINCHPNNDVFKSNFVNLIQTHFSPIPGLPSNYYFFDYENIQKTTFSLGGTDSNVNQRKEHLLKFYRNLEEGHTDLCEVAQRAKHVHGATDCIQENFTTIKDEDECVENETDSEHGSLIYSKPFFVSFSYSFSFKSGPQILKTTSIPTCLFELFSAENDINLEEIQLENLRVLLNIEIITQNCERPLVACKRVSVVSNDYQLEGTDTIRFLNSTLDEFQIYKYLEFLQRIEWLIRDEIVSISHNSFRVSAPTLEMVVEHIKKTGKSNNSQIDKVELKFIIDDDKPCLQQLNDMLSELKFANFQLAGLKDFYYVIHRSVPEPEQNKSTLLFTSSKEESFERENCLVFNEELFDDKLACESVNIVGEYTIEENENSNLSPNFWLILFFEQNIGKSCVVWLYFHSRQNIYLYGLEIFNQLKKSLEMLVKKINQKVLLERLDETRECDDLLITVEDKDPYTKANIRSALNSTPVSHLNIEPELEMTEDKNFKLVKKNFAPGSFSCDVVWDKHFPLHPRLHGKDGVVAIRAVLSSFTVANRNNLYVYKEKSGSVFYLRIYEIECTKHMFNEKFSYSMADSSSTVSELTEINNFFFDNIISSNEFCHNDSLRADSDRDTDSIASFSNIIKPMERISQQCILLNVHGVTEPGVFIKEDMVGALQKKLDEAVLDNLILMLARNPLSKFTFEDVCFIQSQNSSFENFYFVINENYMSHMTNIKSYIRQNLSTFMYSPKYTDSNSEFHFKLFKNDEFHCVMDEDVFILHCQQESGKDSKGVACVILSIVSKEKIAANLSSSFVLSKTDVNDFIFGNFDSITSCYSHLQENTNARFYINFQVWSSGKIDTEEHLKNRLIDTIHQSLWDFNLEFNIFKLCSFENNRNTLNSMSEPSTPKKLSDKRERRSGLSSIQPNVSNLDETKFFSAQQLWKRQDTSSPQMVHGHVSKENYFDFEMNLDKVNDLSCNFQETKNRELTCLSHMINVAVKPWLDFGKLKQVPSLKKYVFNIVQKNSISTIIKEFNGLIPRFGSDMNAHFLMSNAQNYCEFDLNSESTFEESNHLMILLRHETLWNTKHLHADMENSFTKLYHKVKNERSKLCFPPVFSTSKSGNDSSTNLNTSEANRPLDELLKCIAPRQKFLLLYVEDRYIQLYLYNWISSFSTTIVGLFSNLIIWHNSRSLLQQSLILQKAGIFHHLPFKRYSFDDILKLSKVNFKDLNLPQLMNIQSTFNKENPSLSANIFKNTDLLLKHTNPLEAIKDFKENKDAQNKGESIFDPKNYSFIFSNFDSNSTRNLFDCFNGQFNSNYNLYIKDLKDLSKVWQLHGSKLNTAIMDKITSHVKKYGRLSHFCLTPFLFSHKWRYSIAMVRDHNTPPAGSLRSRHMSGGQLLNANSTEHEFALPLKRSRRKSGPPNMLEHSTLGHRGHMDECLDSAVCPHYIHEYVQYLQSLGFSSIKSQKNGTLVTKNSFEIDRRNDRFKTGVPFNRKTSYKNEVIKFYSIKTLPGGFFLFEIGFCEPYVYSYLYSFDSTRFSSWNKSDSFVSQMNTINFLDELDSIKARMHLHSFTYDYHLRAIHSYISGRQLYFHQGYHLISFLDDFIKYYQKAPNYARNHVYSDNIMFESTRISADQLYKYISDHNKLYGLDVFQMNSTNLEIGRIPLLSHLNKECVLIHLSSHRIPYHDENHIRQEDNFDVGVLITNQRFVGQNIFLKDSNNLCLKFFLLLTSQRELFPKLSPFGDSKGAFRAIRVRSSNLSASQSRKSSVSKAPDALETPISRQPIPILDTTYSGICDEKINYLGYFNAHEIVMQHILTEKVNQTKEQLKRIITMAEIDCRRDCLWNCLIPSNSEQRSDVQISLDELNELLVLVKSIRLDEYDQTLAQFYSFNYQWYKTLAQKLELKFEFTHRKFPAKDNTYCKMAFFKTNCKDCFILFELRSIIPFVEFKIVLKKPPEIEIDDTFLQHCNPQYHELVEEFINACTSHMWVMM